MVIIDEPYASVPLLEWLAASEQPVLANDFAKRTVAERGIALNLVGDDEAASRVNAGERVYTCTENALSWILEHTDNADLKSAISLFKDKGLMRENLAPLTPSFFYERVGRDELAGLDASKLPFPVVLKPNVGFCSMGVYVIDGVEAWKGALADIEACEATWQEMYPESVIGLEDYLIEGYIKGAEYALDAYYDAEGQPQILNIWRHDFASDEDTSDRLYSSSATIIEEVYDAFEKWLCQVNEVVGAHDFCFHAETRMTDAGIVPIEFNPLRFAGLSGTDMAYYACGYRTYECYLEDAPLDLRGVYEGHPGDVYSMCLLGSAGEGAFDYDAFLARFSDVLEIARFDVEKVGSYGFMFLHTPEDDSAERDFVLRADLREFLH